ncbi:MAG: tyrosine-type recombinase/integrase [Myxococcota bacterium]
MISQGVLGGRRYRRRQLIPDNDEELAAELVRQLNVRFTLGDFRYVTRTEGVGGRASPAQSASRDTLLFSQWAPRWLESYRPPVVGQRCYENYRQKAHSLMNRFGAQLLAAIDQAAILDLRTALEQESKRPSTVRDYLAVLRLILRDAVLRGHLEATPFAQPLPARRTKRSGKGRGSKRVTFRPFAAQELEVLLEVVRGPRDATEGRYFPLVEFLLLTGLRWGEGAGMSWSRVSWTGGLIHIADAAVRGTSELSDTKTATEWTIKIREPVSELLMCQRERSYVGRTEGLVFPGPKGDPMSYTSWLRRGWRRALDRARVNPREGDAQKALRRSYITSALVCGRNPKLVASEVGHASTRMVTEQYDSFVDPAKWPDDDERSRLATVYGWPELVHPKSSEVPYGSPRVPSQKVPRRLDS